MPSGADPKNAPESQAEKAGGRPASIAASEKAHREGKANAVTLENWMPQPAPSGTFVPAESQPVSLQGEVTDDPAYPNSPEDTLIITPKVVSMDKDGIIECEGGRFYKLGEPHPDHVARMGSVDPAEKLTELLRGRTEQAEKKAHAEEEARNKREKKAAEKAEAGKKSKRRESL